MTKIAELSGLFRIKAENAKEPIPEKAREEESQATKRNDKKPSNATPATCGLLAFLENPMPKLTTVDTTSSTPSRHRSLSR